MWGHFPVEALFVLGLLSRNVLNLQVQGVQVLISWIPKTDKNIMAHRPTPSKTGKNASILKVSRLASTLPPKGSSVGTYLTLQVHGFILHRHLNPFGNPIPAFPKIGIALEIAFAYSLLVLYNKIKNVKKDPGNSKPCTISWTSMP